jgi:hypothetical protein
VSLHNKGTTLNGGAAPKSVHRTIESVYIKKENVQSDTDEEVRIFLKWNVYNSLRKQVLYNKFLN